MLDNKVLVNLYVLSLNTSYELFIPINEKIGNVAKLLNTTLFDAIDNEKNYVLINVNTGYQYKNNELIRDTDIKNGCKLLLV